MYRDAVRPTAERVHKNMDTTDGIYAGKGISRVGAVFLSTDRREVVKRASGRGGVCGREAGMTAARGAGGHTGREERIEN